MTTPTLQFDPAAWALSPARGCSLAARGLLVEICTLLALGERIQAPASDVLARRLGADPLSLSGLVEELCSVKALETRDGEIVAPTNPVARDPRISREQERKRMYAASRRAELSGQERKPHAKSGSDPGGASSAPSSATGSAPSSAPSSATSSATSSAPSSATGSATGSLPPRSPSSLQDSENNAAASLGAFGAAAAAKREGAGNPGWATLAADAIRAAGVRDPATVDRLAAAHASAAGLDRVRAAAAQAKGRKAGPGLVVKMLDDKDEAPPRVRVAPVDRAAMREYRRAFPGLAPLASDEDKAESKHYQEWAASRAGVPA